MRSINQPLSNSKLKIKNSGYSAFIKLIPIFNFKFFIFNSRASNTLLRLACTAVFLLAGVRSGFAQFAGGDGTEGNPYQISNVTQLQAINDYSMDNLNFILINDIDASDTKNWNDGAGFLPIGTGLYFKGWFDGNGHRITDLYINRLSNDAMTEGKFLGLFSTVHSYSGISHFGLENIFINGVSYVGGLAGNIIGFYPQTVYISHIYITGYISAFHHLGGVLGNNVRGDISNCYIAGDIVGKGAFSYWGKIIGENQSGEIKNCYTALDTDLPTVTGDVLLTNTYARVLDDPIGAERLASAMRQDTTFHDWDFTNFWEIQNGITFPYLKFIPPVAVPGLDFEEGYGFEGAPYEITSVDELQRMEHCLTCYYELQNNIDVSETSTWNAGEGFVPIGDNISAFNGTFDGGEFVISNLTISRSTDSYQGLFGYASGTGTVIKDVGLETLSVEGGAHTGGLAGRLYDGASITNSYTTGSVTGTGNSKGGLVGSNHGGSISQSYSETTVNSSGWYTGGLVGINESLSSTGGSISKSYAKGNVTGERHTGALAGRNYNEGSIGQSYAMGTVNAGDLYSGGLVGSNNGGVVSNSFAMGDVISESNYAGGFVGINSELSGQGGIISTSYSTGIVEGSNFVGGFAGGNSGSVTQGFWNTSTSGVLVSSGGTGLLDNEFREQNSFSGFDFGSDWTVTDGRSYPYLNQNTPLIQPGYIPSRYPGASLMLNGTSQYIKLDQLNTEMHGVEDLTIEFWMKEPPSGQVEPNGVALFAINTSPGGNVLLLMLGGDTQNGFLNLWAGDNNLKEIEIDLGDSEWHHIAFTYSNNTGKIYIDGILEDEIGLTLSLATDDFYSIGAEYDTHFLTDYFKGHVDEVRVWAETRTHEEILGTMFQSLSGTEENLAAYYSFDRQFVNQAFDLSQNALHGSYINSPEYHHSKTPPYGTFITGDEGWRMLTVPASGISYGEMLDTLWTQGFVGSDYTGGTSNVYTWDETTQAFTSISNAANVPAAGTGFIIYVFDDDDFDGSGDGFPKIIKTDSTQRSGEISPVLSFTDSGTLADDGWNLVGNPYGTTIDWNASTGWDTTNIDASFYVWSDSANSGAGDYLSWNGSAGTFGGGEIAPWQGFWVKANAASPSLSLTDNTRSAGGILHKKALTPELRFTMSDRRFTNSAIVMLSKEAQTTKDHLDAYKLQSINSEYLSLFTTLEDGSALDINALPTELEEPMELGIDFDGSDLSGEFNLSWKLEAFPDDWEFSLHNNETGQEVDLRKQSAFSFELAKAKSSKVLEALEDSNGLTPRHGVLTPKVMKSSGEEIPRFTLTITPGNVVSNQPGDGLPQVFALAQNYPNPFNPSTVIRYQLPVNSEVDLRVFDVLGREVAALVNRQIKAGYHQVTFDARNLASGMYIYRLAAGNAVITKKLMLIK